MTYEPDFLRASLLCLSGNTLVNHEEVEGGGIPCEDWMQNVQVSPCLLLKTMTSLCTVAKHAQPLSYCASMADLTLVLAFTIAKP